MIEENESLLESKVKNFDNLLSKIESISDKKKRLWREIYENAILDRQNAYAMFGKLSRICLDKSTEHAVHGKTMATYIEKMSKANDQLLKLADLIAQAEKASEEINAEDMFEQINNQGKL